MRGVPVGNGGMDPETCVYFCMLGMPSVGDGFILGRVLVGLLTRASRAARHHQAHHDQARQYMY